MRTNVALALIAGLWLLAAQSGTAWAAQRLEGMSYAPARKVILRNGWKPLAGACFMLGSEQTCRAYPEVNSCSGISPGQCGMVFVRRNRCLYLGTTGGEPGGLGSDTRVEAVTFRAGPCHKE